MRGKLLAITLLLAAIAGVIVAVVVVPGMKLQSNLEAIATNFADERAVAWSWFAEDQGGMPRAAAHLDEINAALDGAPSQAMLDALVRLHDMQLLGWDKQPFKLLEEGTRTLGGARPPHGDHIEVFLALMQDAPENLTARIVNSSANRMMQFGPAEYHDAIYEGMAGVFGPDNAPRMRLLLNNEITADMARRIQLCTSWSEDAGPPRSTQAQDPGLAEGLATLAMTRKDMATDALTAIIDAADESIQPSLITLLRSRNDDAETKVWLQQQADAGNAMAANTLAAMDPEEERRRSAAMMQDTTATRWRRCLAAWRIEDADAADIFPLIAENPADADDSVTLSALLAWKHLTPVESASLAKGWMTSLDDGHKRAGAMLAALNGTVTDALKDAAANEENDVVRTMQQLALWSLGESIDVNGSELAHRTYHTQPSDGGQSNTADFNPDVACYMLLAGDDAALELLTSPIVGDLRLNTQHRAVLIEALLPQWHHKIGRPIGGDSGAIQLHFARLDAWRLLTSKQRTFDEARRRFVPLTAEQPEES